MIVVMMRLLVIIFIGIMLVAILLGAQLAIRDRLLPQPTNEEVDLSADAGRAGVAQSSEPVSERFLTYQDVRAVLINDLQYPESELLLEAGRSESADRTTGKVSEAYARQIRFNSLSEEEVYRWYSERLVSAKWQRSSGFILATTHRSIEGYTRGEREWFYVAVNEPDALAATLGRALPSGRTLFEITYGVTPATSTR